MFQNCQKLSEIRKKKERRGEYRIFVSDICFRIPEYATETLSISVRYFCGYNLYLTIISSRIRVCKHPGNGPSIDKKRSLVARLNGVRIRVHCNPITSATRQGVINRTDDGSRVST